MNQKELTSEELKRKLRNRSAKDIVGLLKEQYKGNINFPEITPEDLKRLYKKLDSCADSWLSDIVNEK